MIVSINNITKSFGENVILKDISLAIEENDRIGLVGENGAGKSTLANVICGRINFEQGEVNRNANLRIGFLEQNSGLDRNSTIIEEMHSVYYKVIEMRERLCELEKIISNHKDVNEEIYKRVAKEYSDLQENFEKNDGYTFEINIKIILNGMGFSDKDYSMEISSLSGGEKTRLALAKLLLEKPDLLILDEPTNHLDFDTLIWLENYLVDYKGAILIISHDRYFLDKLVGKVWEIEKGRAIVYKGNYTKYKLLRIERIQNQMKQYEAQQIEIASLQEYVDKNIARASTSNSAKSRVHALARMEIIEKPITYNKTAKLEFTFAKDPVKDVLTVSNLEVAVGEPDNRTVLVNSVDFELKRGEKVAIVGANGIGKSTFLKSLLGIVDQVKGEITWGKNVGLSYYDQENQNLNSDNTALGELWNRFPREIESKIRANLGRVLLTGDSVFKKVSVLSGGERAKLAFAVVLMEGCNTLILDEPTNHLDLATKEILEESLREFKGTMLFISHDRYLLNSVPTKIIELTKDGFTVYNGNFDYYIQKKQLQQEAKPLNKSDMQAKPNVNRKQQRSEVAKRRARILYLEKIIAEYEAKVEQLNIEISLPENAADYLFIGEKCEEVDRVKQELEEYVEEWLTLMDDSI